MEATTGSSSLSNPPKQIVNLSKSRQEVPWTVEQNALDRDPHCSLSLSLCPPPPPLNQVAFTSCHLETVKSVNICTEPKTTQPPRVYQEENSVKLAGRNTHVGFDFLWQIYVGRRHFGVFKGSWSTSQTQSQFRFRYRSGLWCVILSNDELLLPIAYIQ